MEITLNQLYLVIIHCMSGSLLKLSHGSLAET